MFAERVGIARARSGEDKVLFWLQEMLRGMSFNLLTGLRLRLAKKQAQCPRLDMVWALLLDRVHVVEHARRHVRESVDAWERLSVRSEELAKAPSDLLSYRVSNLLWDHAGVKDDAYSRTWKIWLDCVKAGTNSDVQTKVWASPHGWRRSVRLVMLSIAAGMQRDSG